MTEDVAQPAAVAMQAVSTRCKVIRKPDLRNPLPAQRPVVFLLARLHGSYRLQWSSGTALIEKCRWCRLGSLVRRDCRGISQAVNSFDRCLYQPRFHALPLAGWEHD